MFEGDDDKPQLRHEDDDPLVVAAAAVCADDAVSRRPGLITFRLPAPKTGSMMVVTRSRFDGDYGDIVRIRRYDHSKPDAAVLPMTFAPAFLVLEALTAADKTGAGDRLADIYEDWVKKGSPKQ